MYFFPLPHQHNTFLPNGCSDMVAPRFKEWVTFNCFLRFTTDITEKTFWSLLGVLGGRRESDQIQSIVSDQVHRSVQIVDTMIVALSGR